MFEIFAACHLAKKFNVERFFSNPRNSRPHADADRARLPEQFLAPGPIIN
jgi:hypothetical protein